MTRNIIAFLVCIISFTFVGLAQKPDKGPGAGAVAVFKYTTSASTVCTSTLAWDDGYGEEWDHAVLDHPILNGNPDAIVSATGFLVDASENGSKWVSSMEDYSLGFLYLADRGETSPLILSMFQNDSTTHNCPTGRWIVARVRIRYYQSGVLMRTDLRVPGTFFVQAAKP